MCAAYDCEMDTRRLFFPSTACAIRKVIAMHQSQSATSVCAAKAQRRDHHGLKINAKVFTHKCCCECNWRKACAGREVRFVRCGYFQELRAAALKERRRCPASTSSACSWQLVGSASTENPLRASAESCSWDSFLLGCGPSRL